MAYVTERCNAFHYLTGKNSAATVPFTKEAGYRNFRVKMEVHFLSPFAASRVLELNCLVQGFGSVAFAGLPFRQAKIFSTGVKGYWYPVEFLFTGFSDEEMTVLVTLERRNDTTKGTPTQTLMLIRKTMGISEN